MELKLKNDRVLDPSELIFDSKKLIALGRLYHTLVSKSYCTCIIHVFNWVLL